MANEVKNPIVVIYDSGLIKVYVHDVTNVIYYTTNDTIPNENSPHIDNDGYNFRTVGTFNKGTTFNCRIRYNSNSNIWSDNITETVLIAPITNTEITFEYKRVPSGITDNLHINFSNSNRPHLGTFYVTWDGSDPITNGVIWDRYDYLYEYKSDDVPYTADVDCVLKVVRKYGDYVSEVFEFTLGNGLQELLPPIIESLTPIEITNPNTAIRKTGIDFKYTGEDGTEHNWGTFDSSYKQPNAVVVEARTRTASFGITENNTLYTGIDKYYRYSDVVKKDVNIQDSKPTIIFEDTKINISCGISSAIIYYNINGGSFTIYNEPLSVKSKNIIEAYFIANEIESKHAKYEVPKIEVPLPIVNIDNDTLTVTNYEDELDTYPSNYIFRCDITFPDGITSTYTNYPVSIDEYEGQTLKIEFLLYNELNRLVSNKNIEITVEAKPTLLPPILNDDNYSHVTAENPNIYGDIYYTKDNTSPIDNGKLLEGNTIPASKNDIIQAVIKYNDIVSEIVSITFIPLDKPIITISKDSITITNPNNVGQIYYSIQYEQYGDWTNEILYTDILNINIENWYGITAQVKYETKYSDTTYTYSSDITILAPTININENGLVTITNNDDNSTKIYYKIGNLIYIPIDDDTEIKEYSEPFIIENNTYVYAVATRNDKYSEIVSALYTKDVVLDDEIIIPIYDSEDKVLDNSIFKNFVDVIFSDNYEIPKTINAISYILNAIIKDFDINIPSEENLNRRYSGDNLIIYNDETSTGLLDINCDKEINILNNYKYPYWDKGKWNLNYFRNTVATITKPTDSDNQSIIYGKYFVIRFIFNNKTRFKLETIEPNINVY